MTVLETYAARNAEFAAHGDLVGLRLMPTSKTIVIGCVDPRVPPSHILGIEVGEAAILRNVGGRVTPGVVRELTMLATVTSVAGGVLGPGWNLVVLHHTDCGMTDLAAFPDLLAEYFEIPADQLEAKAVSDPVASVAVDVAVLKDNPHLPGGFLVSGLVYDVGTGLTKTVVAPALLRAG
jgi:carbonic anhydrase